MNGTFLTSVYTDDTDTLDSENDLEASPPDSTTLQRINQQLEKWLASYPLQINQQQFTSLLNKCGIVNDQKIFDIFYALDYEANNLVHKDVLLQNDYLANLIARLIAEEEQLAILDEEECDDTLFNHCSQSRLLNASYNTTRQSSCSEMLPLFMDLGTSVEATKEIEHLKRENERLSRWIEDIGRPATEDAERLRHELRVYRENEQDHKEELNRLKTERQSFMLVQQDFLSLRNEASMISEENENLKSQQISSRMSINQEHSKLRAANKTIKSLQKINKDLTTINERYREENQRLNLEKEAIQVEVNNLRSNLMERLDEAQQIIQSKTQQIVTISEENNSLRQQLAESETKLENCEQSKEMMASDDIAQLSQSRFQNTLTIRNRTEMNLDENGALSLAMAGSPGTQHPSLMPLKSGLPLTPESSNSTTTTNALFFVRSGVSPNDTDSVHNLVGCDSVRNLMQCDSRMSISADDFLDESQMKQRESEIREKVKKEMKEQFEIQSQQIQLDADMKIQQSKQESDQRIQGLEDEVGRYKENEQKLKKEHRENAERVKKQYKEKEQRLKEEYRTQINSLRQRIDLLEFEASENENFVYAALNECDRVNSLSRLSRQSSRSRSDARQNALENQQSCRVNWGFLFGKSRGPKLPDRYSVNSFNSDQ